MDYGPRPQPTLDVALAVKGTLASVRQTDEGWRVDAPTRSAVDPKLDHALAKFLDCAPGTVLDLALRVAAADPGSVVIA